MRDNTSHKLMVFVIPAITLALLVGAVLLYGFIAADPFHLWTPQ